MNNLAYDISHLFEADMIELDGNHYRPAAPQAPVLCKAPSVQALQEAMARELLQADAMHEALIRQYLRIAGDALAS
ncbi:MAG: hypothetical protein KGM46_02475 [Pseudomonadota bacterium]|jgi:hypothetical protein|nr:hypothetical protein [Xanthomonadaceae bacterium]MDE2248569.1 hypothetical protein [Xanthomonadaceae bacterium]MDE3209587.1 hypothetical protein [Pseudomonadota bacterium]